MNPYDPILDQPQSIEVDELDAASSFLLANPEIRFRADAHTDLVDLRWPWADALYARSIRMGMTLYTAGLQADELAPMVNRYYPGYQETIYGSEILIVSKRLAAPFHSADDRCVIWTCECQAEGDTLVRFDVDIDWGEALTQRIVDGLLVAQRNPRPGQGVYRQSNAESTRVFGNPHARPDTVALDDAVGTARLTYLVLVNGIVDVSFLLTLSDVGEQVAWNAFLAQRDTERSFQLSNKAWDDALKTARVWTPDTRFNRAVQAGKLATLQNLVHLRAGMAPADRRVERVPALVAGLDALDLHQSRNVLAHLRRVAERNGGCLPTVLPVRAKDPLPAPGPALPFSALAAANAAYLAALHSHLQRHFDAGLLADHMDAVRLCAEALVQRHGGRADGAEPHGAEAARALDTAVALAALHGAAGGADAARWESEAVQFARQAAGAAPSPAPDLSALDGWHTPAGSPWTFDDPWAGVALAAEAVWRGAGVRWEGDTLAVRPAWPQAWPWWALVGLPVDGAPLTLVWDGATLHSTHPVASDLPVQVTGRIRTLNTEDTDFDLQFEFMDGSGAGGNVQQRRFRPAFAQLEH
jgi:hypothetical protein